MNGKLKYLIAIALVVCATGCAVSHNPGGNNPGSQGTLTSDNRSDLMKAKQVPEITWQNVRPPYNWWNFFTDAENHPFRYRATGLDMRNAWWLIEASTLAYSDPEIVKKTFARAGLPVVRLFDAKSTQCFVASNDDFIIVVFRGTEIRLRDKDPRAADIIYDLITDVNARLVPRDGGGLVHEGFRNGLDEVWKDKTRKRQRIKGLKSYLDELSAQKERPIWFTGHSLGAALATLAADRYGKAQGLYTFGSPRVGNKAFSKSFNVAYFRFVNSDDLAPRVPPEAFSYRHVGNMIFIDAGGNVNAASQADNGMPETKDSHKEIAKSIDQLRKQSSPGIPSWALNHVPLLYSTYIWNSYIQLK